jgi:hypothetical protein
MELEITPAPVPVVTTYDGDYVTEYEELKKFLQLKLRKPITKAKIIILIAAGIKFIEQFKSLSGLQKKDLVIRGVRDVITNADLSEDEKELLLDVLDTLGDAAIDMLVEFGRDTVTFVKQSCETCKSKCHIL